MTTPTAAAREAARNHSNGQFGEQHLADPGQQVLERTSTQQESAYFLMGANFTLSETDVYEAFRAAGIPEGQPVTMTETEQAKEWLRVRALIGIKERDLHRDLADLQAAKRRTATTAVKVAALRIRQAAPQVDTIRLVRGGMGLCRWEAADADGQPIELPEQARTDLLGYQPLIDMHDTDMLHQLATGRRWDGRPPTGAQLDQDGRTVAVELDWQHF